VIKKVFGLLLPELQAGDRIYSLYIGKRQQVRIVVAEDQIRQNIAFVKSEKKRKKFAKGREHVRLSNRVYEHNTSITKTLMLATG